MPEKFVKTLIKIAQAAQEPQKTGHVEGLEGPNVTISGEIINQLKIHDPIKILGSNHQTALADVISLSRDTCTALLRSSGAALHIADVALAQKPHRFACHGGYLGQVIRPDGRHWDKAEIVTPKPPFLEPAQPIKGAEFGKKLETQHPIFNTLLPIAKGQRLGLFAGSGVGKTSLLRDLVQKTEFDIAIIALVGERGREVKDWFAALDPQVREKTVIMAAPSNASALERRDCAFHAMELAKLYRATGQSVLYLCDSLTRLAEAHREMSTALGELPVMRGHPPSLVPLLSGLCEEAGNTAQAGAITALFTVLVAGSDMEEPIADIVRGILDGHVILDRALAEKGHFPAVDVLRSLSRSDTWVLNAEEQRLNTTVRQFFQVLRDNQIVLDAGLYHRGQNPQLDRALSVREDLNTFLTQREPRTSEWHFEQLKSILATVA